MYDETIIVREEHMRCSKNPNSLILHVAKAVQDHYGCPWRAAEDVTLTVKRIMVAQGWTVKIPRTDRTPEPVPAIRQADML